MALIWTQIRLLVVNALTVTKRGIHAVDATLAPLLLTTPRNASDFRLVIQYTSATTDVAVDLNVQIELCRMVVNTVCVFSALAMDADGV
jgi:hypothetical protein